MDWLVIGALTIVINVILYAVLSSRLHRQYNSKTFLQAAQKEMELLMTEMNQSAERNVAVFEDRVQKLRLLMEELDHKLVMVRKDHDLNERSRHSYSQVRERIMESRRGTVQGGLDVVPAGSRVSDNEGTGPGMASRTGSPEPVIMKGLPAESANPPDALDPEARNAEPAPVRVNRTGQSDTPESRLRMEDHGTSHPAARAIAKVQAREELKRKVVGLHRSGMDAGLIASQTGMSRGEVDLIISLGEGGGG